MAAAQGNQYALGNRGGRPKVWTDELISVEANELRKFMQNDEGEYLTTFCHKRKLNPAILSEWAKTHEEFAEALEEAKTWQEQKFIRKSLTREWDGSFAKYVMARVCGDKWKASYDSPEGSSEAGIAQITINKIYK